MATLQSKKVEEANEHLKEAEKCLKTGLLKWKPDYDSAVSEYTKAAVAFRVAKSFDLAIATYVKAADIHQKMNSFFHAAKSLEEAAMICKDTSKYAEAADLVDRAATLYCESSSADTAVNALEKAAKMLENVLPDKAIALYIRGGDVAEAQDRMQQSAQMFGKAGRLYARNKQFAEAAKYLRMEIDGYLKADGGSVVCKIIMGLILVYLHQEDTVSADRVYQTVLGQCAEFVESDEAGPIGRLLEAYEQGDQEKVAAIVASPLFRSLENDFMKLARDLPMPVSVKPASSSRVAAAIEDDEFADGLQ